MPYSRSPAYLLFSAIRPRVLTTLVAATNGILISLAAAAEPAVETALQPAPLRGVAATEDALHLGLRNRHVAITLRKRDGAVAAITPAGGANCLAASGNPPLWSLEWLDDAKAKPAVLDARSATAVVANISGSESSKTLQCVYTLVEAVVRAEIRLGHDEPRPRWRLEVAPARGRLWSATFPQLAVAVPAGGELLIPRRRGTAMRCGPSAPRFEIRQPYPGPSAKFQLMALYGKREGHGFYFAAEDPDAYSKVFIQRNEPSHNAVVLAVEHQPEGRGSGVNRFRLPYQVVAGPFRGDWWDAGRAYRAWWTRQVWASKGLLVHRSDLPPWLAEAGLVLRPSTTSAARTVAGNLQTIGRVREAFAGHPLLGIWYGWQQPPWAAKGLDDGGHGRVLPPLPSLAESVRRLAGQDVHFQGYLQSVIYDGRNDDADSRAAMAGVTRDAEGRPVSYGTGKQQHLWAMCRASPWWQARMIAMARATVQQTGFAGIYLDSFGKGAAECFAPDHGHPVGGGRTVIQGQRLLARRIREAIAPLCPQPILSGEDPVEAFRDLLDVHLYAVNVTANYRPIYRTVWGDYSLGHGRVLSGLPSTETLVAESAVLFVEGTILGRLYCEGLAPFLRPEGAAELVYLKRLAAYTRWAIDYLRFGEYLRPLALQPVPPIVTFTDAVEKQRVEVPAIVHSVTRSHRDGSIAIALVNIGARPYQGQVPVDPSLRGAALVQGRPKASLTRMDEQGRHAPLGSGTQTWLQPLQLAPRDVMVWVLR